MTENTNLRKTMLELPVVVYQAFESIPAADTEKRNAYASALRAAGWTLESISMAADLTRERVRQVIDPAVTVAPDGLPVPTPPAKPVKVPREYNEPDPAKLARLKAIQEDARKSRGTGSKYQAAGDEWVALLGDIVFNDGVPIYRLAKRLGVTHGAIASRLTRYGLKSAETYTSKAYTPLVDSERRAAILASVEGQA